jgi:hypothetical protein
MPTGYASADARIADLNGSLADELREAVLDALPEGHPADPGDGGPLPFPGTWWAQIETFRAQIARAVPEGEEFLLVDDQQFGPGVAGDRVARPFPEADGQFAGLPADDAHAIAELRRLQGLGVRWFVVLSPAFWWLDHYRGLAGYLAEYGRCVARNEHLVAYCLAR